MSEIFTFELTPELIERIAKAGTEFDGHVTNGSLSSIIRELRTASNPGKVLRPRMDGIAFQTDPRQTYPNGEIRGPKP